ncbi:MAG: M48 family metallopeptidase [Planctomycetaceae bacterium]|nr:M48 family metallopeptidase [Planctomycetaceae bacterium]
MHPDGEVGVAAPKGLRLTKIEEAISDKADWILQQQESFRQLQRGFPRQFISGESYFYMGRQYRLKVRRSQARDAVPAIRLYGGCFEVVVPSTVSADGRSNVVRQQLVYWYCNRAQEVLPEMVSRYCQCLALNQPELSVRQMSKRWGSCNGDNRITINWQILMAPRRLTEYVVAHELVHLVHHDHSRAFWRLFERLMPDFETRRQELAIHGAKYQL